LDNGRQRGSLSKAHGAVRPHGRGSVITVAIALPPQLLATAFPFVALAFGALLALLFLNARGLVSAEPPESLLIVSLSATLATGLAAAHHKEAARLDSTVQEVLRDLGALAA
jgi:hypothetical protein